MALNLNFRRKVKQQIRRQLIAYTKPKSPIAEQFRNVRTNIQFSAVDTDLQAFIVTSANPAEGKTTVTANLAVVFAQQGKKVLLIDADMRKPALHNLFYMDNLLGLTSVLSKQEFLSNCVQATSVDNLKFLPSGAIPPNPAELLGSAAMRDLLEEAKSTYDIVILDTPPVLVVTDAQVLANQVDGTVLVVRSGQTDKDTAVKAKVLLENTKGKLLGVILNDKEQKDHQYYYYYGTK